jgi:hypothetical protein
MNWRVPLGFVIAPIIPCTLTVLPGIVARPEWTGGWGLILIMVLVSELISLVVAVPTYFLLRRYWRVGLMQCLVSGAAIGVLFVVVTLLWSMSMPCCYSAGDSGGPTIIDSHYTFHGWVQNAASAGYSALLGASIGLVFWAVAVRSPKKRLGAA